MSDASTNPAGVDAAMVAFQAALSAREIYGSDHNAAVARLDQAHRAILGALDGRDDFAVLFLPDRVVHGESVLPTGRALAAVLGGRLARRGIDGLVFKAGVTPADVAALLLHITHASAGPFRCDRIELRRLDDDADPSRFVPGGVRVIARLGEIKSSVESAWSSLAGGERTDAESLAGAVADICASAGSDRRSVLHLAHLKNHDEYTFTHTINVAIGSAALGHAVGFRGGEVHDLVVAGLLHDVGKQRIPAEIINKPGKLDERELTIVRRHPEDGARMLFGMSGVPHLAPIVALEHHAHLDGTGYPALPTGRRPHLASQIVQLVDVFDAMRTARSYRAPLPLEKTLAIMAESAGSKYDQALFDAFVEHVVYRTDRELQAPPPVQQAA